MMTIMSLNFWDNSENLTSNLRGVPEVGLGTVRQFVLCLISFNSRNITVPLDSIYYLYQSTECLVFRCIYNHVFRRT
jgi:hypothetical protein